MLSALGKFIEVKPEHSKKALSPMVFTFAKSISLSPTFVANEYVPIFVTVLAKITSVRFGYSRKALLPTDSTLSEITIFLI